MIFIALESGQTYEWVTKHNANANDDMYACVTLHDTNVNDDIHACVAPQDAHTLQPHPLSNVHNSLVVLSCLHLHTHMHFGSS